MMKPQQSQRDNGVLDPRFMAFPPYYSLNAIRVGLPTEQTPFTRYPVDTLNTFVSDPFTDNTLEAGLDPYYMNYDFNDANALAAFASPAGEINPNQTFIKSPRNATHRNLAGYPQNNWSH